VYVAGSLRLWSIDLPSCLQHHPSLLRICITAHLVSLYYNHTVTVTVFTLSRLELVRAKAANSNPLIRPDGRSSVDSDGEAAGGPLPFGSAPRSCS
jgi:hypothetical protein